jgi:glycosyltransferase involved in cell wall biosynthesis
MEKNKKIKVLVVPSDTTGVGKFRSINPHVKLEEYYSDEFSVDIDYQPNINDINFLKQYDIIHYHRTLGDFDNVENVLKICDSLGIVTIMDLDDHWSPGSHHPAYLMIKESGLDKKIANNLKTARNITTTTSLFATEIKNKLGNKNVFVLPNAIDPTEKQYIPNPEKSDRIRIGWLGGSCYDDTTEVLTENGFKLFKDLGKDEKVATLNPTTNEIEYHIPTHYIAEPFNGELNCVSNNLIDYSVTPNHKMYVSTVKNLGHKNLNYSLIPSENVHGQNFHVKRNGIWNGEEKEYFTLPAYVSDKNIDMQPIISLFNENNLLKENELLLEYEGVTGVGEYNGKKQTIKLRRSVNDNFYLSEEKYINEKYGSEKQIKMDDWLKFFGFWIAEGWSSKTKGLYQVGVAQVKNNGFLEEMFVTLQNMGFNPTYTKDGNQVRVFDKQLWQYLSQFGDAITKFIPKDIMNLSSRQLNILLDWYIKGDGHTEKQYGRNRAWTSSKVLSDNMQEIALKTGIAATITNRGKKNSEIKGRKIINQHDSYQLGFSKHPSVSKHNKLTPLVKTEEQYTRPYDGIVYCVEVENHILYVRRNGKPFWCGNSHLSDLVLLKEMVVNLKTDKLLDKVQLVVCGFDLRGTITTIDEKTRQQTQRAIYPKESVWYKYEQIFTDNYTTISEDYKNFLLTFKQEEYSNIQNEPYRRVWTKPITSYATNYNLFDIALAPVIENDFNKVKSQLKVIESGFHKKALVAQNYGPYQIDLVNAYTKPNKGENVKFNDKGNAYLVDSGKNHKQWYQHIKKLITNPEQIEVLGNNLYETVKDTYSMEAVCETRRELYKKLYNEKQNTTIEKVMVNA